MLVTPVPAIHHPYDRHMARQTLHNNNNNNKSQCNRSSVSSSVHLMVSL